jgi:predicted RNA binding protein YcfA (HicA-like mRNA interferase family)
MKPRKVLNALLQGSLNVRFRDMLGLAEAFGFRLDRVRGSHHILTHPRIPEILNFQEIKGQVKPYQVRQFLRLVERYNLELPEE